MSHAQGLARKRDRSRAAACAHAQAAATAGLERRFVPSRGARPHPTSAMKNKAADTRYTLGTRCQLGVGGLEGSTACEYRGPGGASCGTWPLVPLL